MLRLYTEDTTLVRKQVLQAMRKGLNCTQYVGQGSWKGIPENSLVVESTDDSLPTLRELSKAIIEKANQTATLLVKLQSEVIS